MMEKLMKNKKLKDLAVQLHLKSFYKKYLQMSKLDIQDKVLYFSFGSVPSSLIGIVCF